MGDDGEHDDRMRPRHQDPTTDERPPITEAVLLAIERGWAHAERPRDDNLAGQPSCCGEYGYVAEFFRGKDWRDVDLQRLREEYPGPHDACLSFMSPEAFRYFLAAYMVIAVGDRDAHDSATDAAVFALTPPRHRPEIDALARKVSAQAAREDPRLDADALYRAGGTSPESVGQIRAWWNQRVTDFTPEQRRAIVLFLEWAAGAFEDELTREALLHWSRGNP